MAKSEPKFRKIMVRLPLDRSAELDEAAKELGLPPANFACMEIVKVLNARRAARAVETVAAD